MVANSGHVLPHEESPMIESQREHAIPFGDVAIAFGVERRTVRHWFAVGLESIRRGRRLCTSNEALHRFASDDSKNFQAERKDVSDLLDSLSDRQ